MTHTPPLPEIDVVITTYNNEKLVVALLDDLACQEDVSLHIVVMDDASSDGTAAAILSSHPEVTVISTETNCGPSTNRNTGAAKGTQRYLAFFDDDVALDDTTALRRALNILEENSGVGQLAFQIVSGFEPEILLDCGIMNNRHHFGGIFHKHHSDLVYGKHVQQRRVLGACSAGTLLRREIFERIGGFEPSYFYMAEDLDVSLRVILAGYEVRYEPGIVIRHYESQAMGRDLQRKIYLWFRNNLLVFMRNYPVQHAARMFCLFLSQSLQKKTVSSVREFAGIIGFLIARLPDTIRSRFRDRQWIKRSRWDLVRIGRQLQEDVALHMPTTDLILSVTSACNARCPMCFREKESGGKTELTLDEIRTMADSLSSLKNLIISGGEPFLRSDLVDICVVFINRQNPILTIPTNGSFPEKTAQQVKQILGHGAQNLMISLSLDGMREYHDKNRGIAGLFDTVHETYEALVSIQRVYGKKLGIQVNTCVTAENITELESLHEYMNTAMPKASWVFEPVRGCSEESGIRSLSIEEWQSLRDKLEYFHQKHPMPNVKDLRNLYAMGMQSLTTQSQPEPCIGGRGFIAIDHNGDVRPCELLPAVSNLRELNMDVNALTGHAQWQAVRERIASGDCYCTHFCWLIGSWFRNREGKGV